MNKDPVLKDYHVIVLIRATCVEEARNLADIARRAGHFDRVETVREAK